MESTSEAREPIEGNSGRKNIILIYFTFMKAGSTQSNALSLLGFRAGNLLTYKSPFSRARSEGIDLEEEGKAMVENQLVNAYIKRVDHPMTNAGLETKNNRIWDLTWDWDKNESPNRIVTLAEPLSGFSYGTKVTSFDWSREQLQKVLNDWL